MITLIEAIVCGLAGVAVAYGTLVLAVRYWDGLNDDTTEEVAADD